MQKWTRKIWFVIILTLWATSALAEPKVVVTIKPLHSLVAGVMAGVADPALLIDGNMSPHTYQLKPSDAKKISEADLIFWIGSDLERFMEKPLKSLGGKANQVVMLNQPGIRLLPVRKGGVWEIDDHDAHQDAHHDPHIWLDPRNAMKMIEIIAEKLIQADPANKKSYMTNAKKVIAQLRVLDQKTAAALQPVRQKSFIVFHDAYHYLEKRYGLKASGSVVIEPEAGLSAKRVKDVRRKIETSQAVCIFKEPQFDDRILFPIMEGLNIRLGTLDPEGAANVAKGPGAYQKIMENISKSLVNCLAQ